MVRCTCVLTSLFLLLTGCGSDDEERPPITVPTVQPPAPRSAMPGERVVDGWQACGDGVECTTIEVPVDYADPEGARLSLALNRARAPSGLFRGSIVINPGGPGGSGKDFLSALLTLGAQGVFGGFDLVGFDPRGVADSGGMDCAAAAPVLSTVYREGGIDGLIAAFGEFERGCEQSDPALFSALGSINVVRDLDAIRQALGSEQLNFYGASYGSRLGALYAQMFPEQTRAIVLDGVVQPVADHVTWISEEFDAVLAGQDSFLRACADGTLDCPDDPAGVFEQLSVEVAGVIGGLDGLPALWSTYMSIPGGQALMAQLLRAYVDERDAVDMPGGAAGPAEEAPPMLNLGVNVADNLAVHCIDNTNDPPTAAELDALIRSAFARSPVFAPLLYAAAACLASPVRRDPVPPLTAPGSPPLLIIGGTLDTRTPFAWAEEMRASLENAVLVSSAHLGHIALVSDLPCPVLLMRDYFRDLTLPPDGTRCER
ncbi:MAG: alpha/beta fold hydrolase [Deltaproteobacteria bacterium]